MANIGARNHTITTYCQTAAEKVVEVKYTYAQPHFHIHEAGGSLQALYTKIFISYLVSCGSDDYSITCSISFP